jgi:hypothetical protein
VSDLLTGPGVVIGALGLWLLLQLIILPRLGVGT